MITKKEKQRREQINFTLENTKEKKQNTKSEKLLKDKPQFEINFYKKVFFYKQFIINQ